MLIVSRGLVKRYFLSVYWGKHEYFKELAVGLMWIISGPSLTLARSVAETIGATYVRSTLECGGSTPLWHNAV